MVMHWILSYNEDDVVCRCVLMSGIQLIAGEKEAVPLKHIKACSGDLGKLVAHGLQEESKGTL